MREKARSAVPSHPPASSLGARGRLAACALLGGLALAGVAAAQQATPGGDEAALTPETIALAMERAYAGCSSYRDSGVVKTVSLTDGGRFGGEQPFRTAFVRPGRLRFELTDRGLGGRSSRLVVWLSDGDVLTWWDPKPGVRQAASLQEALGAASGLSGGASDRVPGLLLPHEVGAGARLLRPERLEDADDRGVTCIRLKGKSRQTPYSLTMGAQILTVQDEAVTLWLERGTFLLRKVEEARTFDTYRSTRTTTYTPEVNVEIPASELIFSPPVTEPRSSPAP
ncbi:MAG: hypothetical protein MUF10_00160 [Thermoanaerobaculaceae bacterium]|jgi:outer membrane lipoprotein-sorting protein|nr:hypothetical protein [Thermoanaerobaculaceae bacterium]